MIVKTKTKKSISAISSKHYEDVMQYCKDIKSGKILSGIYTKKAIERFLNDLNRQKDEDFLYELSIEQADKIIDFAEQLQIPDLNAKLQLLSWHKFIYYNLFGWVHKLDNSRRRFRTSYVEVARKNSKTTSLLFPIILYDFITTNSAEAFFVSKDGNQSGKTYTELKQIFLDTFTIDKNMFITEGGIRIGSKFIQFFTSEARGIDSYKNSCSVVDEFWCYDTDKIITAFKYGGRARKNNLVLIITSAGTNISGPCYAENEKARKILNGLLTDDTYFTIIYAYDDNDDWKDRKNYIKANPSLGTIIRPEILDNDLADALITPSHHADFQAKTCGIWQSGGITNWIPLQKWLELKNTKNLEDFREKDVYIGLDLSSVGDFTGITLCFEEENHFYLYHKFYVPSETINERYKHENININKWVIDGVVTSIPGDIIDYSYLEKDLKEFAKDFNIVEIAYDKWNSNRLINNLEELFPNTLLVQFDQSLRSMAIPSKDFERLIYEKRIHCNNPCMTWMVGNAVIKPDVNNNYKPLKEGKSSTARIDGVVSSIMALSRCRANENHIPINTDFNSILNLF